MTGVGVGAGQRAPGPSARGAPAPAAGSGAPTKPIAGGRLTIELGLFVALGVVGIAQWSRLVVEPPTGDLLGALAIATAVGAALAALGPGRLPRMIAWPAALLIVLAGAAAAFGLVGLPLRLLEPNNWDELASEIGGGLSGVNQAELPYAGGDGWLRLALLLGAPLILCLSSAVAFWPAARGRTVRRVLALAGLVALYAVAVTLDSPGAELLWGVVLLTLVAAWLWLPALAPRRAAIALATVVAAGVVALPVAAKLDPAAPWWNYETWSWFGGNRDVAFNWDHSYGPLEWPQRGTTLLEVASEQPLYWKASVLDRFDGFTWQRAQDDDPIGAAELAARRDPIGAGLQNEHEEWLLRASFQVEALSSPFVIGSGTPVSLDGYEEGAAVGSTDGTITLTDDELARGDEYSIVTYSPQPTDAQLRAAPDTYPEARFARSTLVGLPAQVDSPAADAASTAELEAEAGVELPSAGYAPSRGLAMPLWGERDSDARNAVLASPYADTYRLASRLTATSETPYEAVQAIDAHLRESYDYTPTVPQHTYPLASFLFEDRAGYCQQFAGTMALMLRLQGIPSRVVSGFAPGSFDADRGVYVVEDFDAHSWVEVYFRGIGWVTFDPTPAAAPAASQDTSDELATPLGTTPNVDGQGLGRVGSLEANIGGGDAGGAASGDGGAWGIAVGIVALGLLAATATAAAVVTRRRRRLESGGVVDAQLVELRRALVSLGWSVPTDATLLALERRFSGAGRGPVARYAAALRAHRYAPGSARPPGARERRALRRALSSGGPRRRLRGLLAIPPGGPAAG